MFRHLFLYLCSYNLGGSVTTAAKVVVLGFLVWGETDRARVTERERQRYSPRRLDGDGIRTDTVDRMPRKPASRPKHLSGVHNDRFQRK
jgi:hypothetical protein